MNARLTELEIKLAYQEDTIQQLDSVICRQQEQIDKLQQQFKQLTQAMASPDDANNGSTSLFDELPPHY